MTGSVRPATDEDLQQILDLYGRVHPGRGGSARTAYMTRVLMQHPWRDDDLPSLVYQDGGGRIVGFLGVLPRPMLMQGRPIRTVVSHHFMVDPTARSTLAGASLMKTLLVGKQDLSICEPISATVYKVWKTLGGATALLQSLHWTRPIRPASYLKFVMGKRPRLAPLAYGMAPVSRLVDAVMAKLRGNPFRCAVPEHASDVLTPDVLLEYLNKFSQDYALGPQYDTRTLSWLLNLLAEKKRRGDLRMRIVRQANGGVIGYYIYYVNRGGVSQVLQVAGQRGCIPTVMENLVYDAWTQGVLALSDRLDPRYAHEIPSETSYFRYNGNWLLLHSRKPDLLCHIYSGDVFLTRLEGEWWIPFHEGAEYGEPADDL